MEKPILFNTEMVKAILDGRKTTTRRIVKRTPSNDEPCGYGFWKDYNEDDRRWYIKDYTHGCVWWTLEEYIRKFCKYHVGDILYVRETWKKYKKRVGSGESCYIKGFYGYKADEDNPNNPSEFYDGNWKPSIHMRKEAARIFFKITGVKIERLQDMTRTDAIQEGFKDDDKLNDNGELLTSLGNFAQLWDTTMKKNQLKMYGWDANPWTWVIEFEVMRDV